MIKAVVVDDELYTLSEICDYLEETGFFAVAGRYQNPLEALNNLPQAMPQVAFIDIEMPEMDGLTLAEKLLEKQPEIMIVFITSWDKYAVRAFDLNALDYILKPVRYPRFLQMVEKIRREIGQKQPLAHKTLDIKCFGSFEARIGGALVKWERAKAEELFAFLLTNHGSLMHKEVIIENLWPEYPVEKALPILQTAICKIRNIFSQLKNEVQLAYHGNCYCLTLKNVQCDYLPVKKLLDNKNPKSAAGLDELEKTCQLCAEGYLLQQGYLWSLEQDQRIKRGLQALLENKLADAPDDNLKKERLLRLLIQVDPYREEYNLRLLQLLKQAGSSERLEKHIQWLAGIFSDEYFMEPPVWLREFMYRIKEP